MEIDGYHEWEHDNETVYVISIRGDIGSCDLAIDWCMVNLLEGSWYTNISQRADRHNDNLKTIYSFIRQAHSIYNHINYGVRNTDKCNIEIKFLKHEDAEMFKLFFS